MPRYYTPLQAAEILGLSKNTMYKYIKDGTIKSVRFGSGKIRILASEISNLVDLSETIVESGTHQDENSSTKSLEKKVDTANAVKRVGNAEQAEAVNIYDWFVGLSAGLLALTYLLMNFGFAGSRIGMVPTWVSLLLFGWGCGHIVTSLMSLTITSWKRLSYLVGSLIFAALFTVLFLTGSTVGISMFAAMSLGLFVIAVLKTKPLYTYLVHVASAILIAILMEKVFPGDYWSIWATKGELVKRMVILTISTLFVVVGVVRIIWQEKVRKVFLVVNFLLVLLTLYLEVIAAMHGMWDRVMLMLIFSVFGAFFPYAANFNWGGGGRKWIVAESVAVISVMAIIVLVVGGLMSNMKVAYVDNVARNTIEEVRVQVDREMERARIRLEGVAQSKLLLSSIESDDPVVQRELMRDMVKSSFLYTQLMFIDANGVVKSIYPDTVPDMVGSDVASQNFYTYAIRGKYYISEELYQDSIEGNPWVITNAVPVYDDAGKIVGALAGRINLDAIQDLMDNLIANSQGNYFVVDKANRVITGTDGTQSFVANSYVSQDAQIAVVNAFAPFASSDDGNGRVLQAVTDCCGWRIVFDGTNNNAVEAFEYVGFAIMLGIMVTLAIAVAVIANNKQGNKQAVRGQNA